MSYIQRLREWYEYSEQSALVQVVPIATSSMTSVILAVAFSKEKADTLSFLDFSWARSAPGLAILLGLGPTIAIIQFVLKNPKQKVRKDRFFGWLFREQHDILADLVYKNSDGQDSRTFLSNRIRTVATQLGGASAGEIQVILARVSENKILSDSMIVQPDNLSIESKERLASSSLLQLCALSGSEYISPDVRKDQRFAKITSLPDDGSIFVFPVKDREERVIYTVSMFTKTRNIFNSDWRSEYALISGSLGICVEVAKKWNHIA